MMLFSKILESCVDPGHRATTLVKIWSAVHIAYTFMEKYPFLLRYTSASSPPRDIIGISVQSMPLTTAGKAAISKKLRLTAGKSDGKHINIAFLFAMHLDTRGIILMKIATGRLKMSCYIVSQCCKHLMHCGYCLSSTIQQRIVFDNIKKRNSSFLGKSIPCLSSGPKISRGFLKSFNTRL